MLYIFDVGNVIIDIDFNRVLGVWSDLGRIPLATLQSRFQIGDYFYKYECGEITDDEFAQKICEELELSLSFEQFLAGWLALFIGVRWEVITIMKKLRAQGDRVVILSNTNHLHYSFWSLQYPDVLQAADKLYLSQEMKLRKPDLKIFQRLLNEEKIPAKEAIFFDDNLDNIEAARRVGIYSLHSIDVSILLHFFTDLK